jgi:hypothetical protein
MSTTTITSAAVDLLAAGTSVAVGTPQRVAFATDAGMGGVLTAKITNGSSGPTGQCVATVYVAHTDGALPAAGAEGATWKRYHVLGGGGLTANAETRFAMELPHGPRRWMIEFSGPAGNAVTAEAQLTRVTGAATA